MRELLRELWTPPDLFPGDPLMQQIYVNNHRFAMAMGIGILLMVPPGLVLLGIAFWRMAQ